MPETREATVELLRRWHAGDRKALETLLLRHLEPLHRHVHAKLQRELGHLRRQLDSTDMVQEAALRVLEYTPPFIPRDGEQFQRLLRKIVLNEIRNELRSPRVRRRASSSALYGDSVLDLRAGADPEASPERAAEQAEQAERARAWARLALEFLPDEDDRLLVLLASVEEWSWREIGDELGLKPDAARVRFNRLLPRLANRIRLLTEGRIDELLAQDED